MQMRPPVQIKSMIKALNDVVLPAVDPANKPAQEQIRLTIGMLTLMAQQLPLQFRFDCDELARLVDLAQQLQQAAGTLPAVASLADVTRDAASVLDRARATPEDVEQGVRRLRAATGDFVTQVFALGGAAQQSTVSQLVLQKSQQQLLRDRSLLLMQGWEPNPAAVPPIATLLEGAAS